MAFEKSDFGKTVFGKFVFRKWIFWENKNSGNGFREICIWGNEHSRGEIGENGFWEIRFGILGSCPSRVLLSPHYIIEL